MHETRVNTNQIALQIRDYEHAGDAIIFLHFSGANLAMWQPTIAHFQDDYRLILVDQRGHGRSDKPDTGYSMDELALDIVGLMQQLGLERAHVVGSSLGAEVGLSLAANHPERVISLVLDGAGFNEYGPYGLWEGSASEFEEHVAGRLDKIRNSPTKVYPSVEALVAERRELFEQYGWWNDAMEAVERYGVYEVEGGYARGMSVPANLDYMEHYFRNRFEDYYMRVHCPLLVIFEKELEDERERAATQALAAFAEHGQIVEVAGWMHPFGWLLDPSEVSRAIRQFLEDSAE